MMTEVEYFNDKEAEAIMWAASELVDLSHEPDPHPQSAIAGLRALGYSNDQIKTAGKWLEWFAEHRYGPTGDSPEIVYAALQFAVERSTWIECYRTHEPTKNSPSHINEALATLRSLAAKFDKHGIEITHIPFE